MIWFEPCCGSAAVALRLLQCNSKPPISYMGSKQGYSDTLLDLLGLKPGQGCGGLVLSDVGPWAAAWATLGNAMPPEDAARWLLSTRWSYNEKGAEHGYGGPGRPVNTVNANWTTEQRDKALGIARMAGIIDEMPLSGARAVAKVIREWESEPPRALWDRLKAEGWPSLTPVSGGRWLGPMSVEEVARHLHFMSLCMVKNGKEGGYSHVNGEGHYFEAKDGSTHHWTPTTPGVNGDRVESLPTFPPLACYQGSASDMVLPDDMTGWITYFDPPYQGTSGYQHGTLGRDEVLRLSLEWSGRGAIVMVSEAEPLPMDGWWKVPICHARKGQTRTFSKQKDEWVTMNRAPQHIPPKQVGMFR